jgi:hypothetical protein
MPATRRCLPGHEAEGDIVGLYLPGLARRGVAVLRLRGVLGEASAGRLAESLRCAFASDPDLLVTDVGGLRG